MTASAVPSTAIPKRKTRQHQRQAEESQCGRVTIMSESIAAMSPSPHQDDTLLKIPIKNDRIFGYTGFCTKSGLGAVAAGFERPACRELLERRRGAEGKAAKRAALK